MCQTHTLLKKDYEMVLVITVISSDMNTQCMNYGSFALLQFLAVAGIQSVHTYVRF